MSGVVPVTFSVVNKRTGIAVSYHNTREEAERDKEERNQYWQAIEPVHLSQLTVVECAWEEQP